MKRLLLPLIAFLILTSCGSQRPFKQVKKNWDKIQAILLLHPELGDSLHLIKHDTIYSNGLYAEVKEDNDSTSWGDDFFEQVDTLANNVVKAPENEKIKPITKLQDKICPKVSKDSLYHVKVYNSDITMYIPVRIHIEASGGHLLVNIKSDSIKLPDPKKEVIPIFKPNDKKFFEDQWFWFFISSLAILVLVLIASLKSRSAKEFK